MPFVCHGNIMNQQLVFEIGSEEIPAGYLIPALNNLKENMACGLKERGLTYSSISGATTPRRLVVCVDGLIDCQPDRVEEILGPPKKAAFDADNKPTKAAEGFAASRGASLKDIQIVSTAKGEYLMIKQEQKGQQTAALLPELLSEMIRSIPFPKSMRWGASRTTFARPIQWILAVYNGKKITFTIDGVGDSGSLTYGHRFMAPDSFEVTSFDQYIADLRTRHVLVDTEERKKAVVAEITQAATQAGGRILPDEELVGTVANLVESPHAICGSFDQKFLALPKDALITSMREHQKYFAIIDAEGNLMPHFIAVNNTKVKDHTLGAEGHQRVLRARLEDGLFFFREDQNRPLAQRVDDLSGIIFQAKLGTMLEKTDRIQNLAAFLAQKLAPELETHVTRAAFLAKADLLTEMVNEFPSLQGMIGRDYARLGGETDEVALAIQEHYMPVRAGSSLPSSTTGAIVSLADRIDTIAGCFGIGQTPTGTADPFGLRRQALGLIHIIEDKKFSLSLSRLIEKALGLYGDKITEEKTSARIQTLEFIKGRFINNHTANGIAIETVEAVTSVVFDDLVDCNCRIQALLAISDQPSFAILAGSFKRVMNIIKDYAATDINPSLFSAEEEKNLHQALVAVQKEAQPCINRKDYEQAMIAILKMKEPIDIFFDKVMVMTDNTSERENRLNLLTSIASLFLQVGDFSRMNR